MPDHLPGSRASHDWLRPRKQGRVLLSPKKKPRGMPRGSGYCLMISRLCRSDVGGLQTLRTFLDIEVDRLAFSQRLESVALDCGEVLQCL
jgi:hypothetical protein